MQKNDPQGPKRVLDAICRLAEAHGTTPPQKMIASELGVNQQYVSQMMAVLEIVGVIQWLGRYTYAVVDATWEPPEVSRL